MKRVVAALAALVLTSIVLTGVLLARAEAAPVFSDDWRCEVEFAQRSRITIHFSPDVSGSYDLYAFCRHGSIRRAVISGENGMIAQGTGEGLLMTADLSAGQRYTLEIEGTGSAVLELMRHVAGRSIVWPVPVSDEGGRIVLPGSVMWHSFSTEAAGGGIYITPDPLSPMELSAELYTADGIPVTASSGMDGGGCRLYFDNDGETEYRLRIYSPSGGRGTYHVRIIETENKRPDSVEIISEDLSIREGDMRSLMARTWPLGAESDLEWASSDASIVEVTSGGVVTGVGEGVAQISVYAYGGLCATVNVTVEKVQPEYIAYRGDFLNVRVGDVLTPSIQIYPAAAADDDGIVYSTSDASIVSISPTGEITAVSEGMAVISAEFGELRSEITVNVEEAPVRYRVLMISEQNYANDVNTVRYGAVNTVYNLESLFLTASYDGNPCAITVEVDITADETYAAIDAAFAGAQEKDVSIIYISCHGYYRDGMTILQFVDGSEIAACDLERALRDIPGTVVIIADCCDSGGLIGSYDDMARMTGGIVSAFAGEDAAFSSSKYKVLASAGLGQDSYRLGYASGENDAVTVFAWALCDALGWNIDDQRRGALNADANYDGKITLWEAYLYTDRRVMWYLSRAGSDYVQDVQVYPEGDLFVLFERE